jgi:hypothetical protein
MRTILVLAIGAIIGLTAGCAQRPTVQPAVPPHTTTRVQPPDWFHQQLTAARAARRDHQPKADTIGAQKAFDDVLHTACTRAALAGPGKYPVRCDAVLYPKPDQSPIDSCVAGTDEQAMQIECSD